MSILNADATTDPHKLLPMKYPWAWDCYKMGVSNNWVPEEIPMQDDIEQWKSNKVLSDLERQIVLWNLGFFSTAESLTGNNIVLAIYKHVTSPEVRMALSRQQFEEAIHSHTLLYCCDSLGLDPDVIYNSYNTIPSIKEKDSFVVGLTKAVFDPNFKTDTKDNVRTFLRDLVGYYVIMEGIFFYGGFSMLLAMKNQNKMTGIGQQIEFILRDESMHLMLGNYIIETIRNENPGVWDKSFDAEVTELIKTAVSLENIYIDGACPGGMLGMAPDLFKQYIRHIADRRLERLGIAGVYGDENPFKWMSQQMDLPKEKNFFETRVTEYSTGTLVWD